MDDVDPQPSFELDHVWVRAEEPAAARAELARLGFVQGAGGSHQGLGTANVVYFFDDVYLEVLWAEDHAALAHPNVARTGLRERLRPGSPASPIGVSYRFATDARGPLPVPSWDWPLPQFPPDAVPMPVADTSEDLHEPLVFASLVTRRPDRRAVTRQEALGIREVSDVEVGVVADALSAVLTTLEAQGLARFVRSERAWLTLTFDRHAQGRTERLRSLPLTLRW